MLSLLCYSWFPKPSMMWTWFSLTEGMSCIRWAILPDVGRVDSKSLTVMVHTWFTCKWQWVGASGVTVPGGEVRDVNSVHAPLPKLCLLLWGYVCPQERPVLSWFPLWHPWHPQQHLAFGGPQANVGGRGFKTLNTEEKFWIENLGNKGSLSLCL